MDLTWDIKQNFIFGYNSSILLNLTQAKNIEKIYMFDLDYTIIKTKSGKKFPVDKMDWELLYPNVQTKFNELVKPNDLGIRDVLVGVISNQKGLKSSDQISDWIDKIKNISKLITIDFVFASITDDRFRKPLTGSYEYIKEKFPNIDWDKISSRNKIYYIGDAFGRPTDFSDTDIKFAKNCGLKFKTPEMFFKVGLSSNNQLGSIEYPKINYFTKVEQDELFDLIDREINNHADEKILIMMIGLPASGKSFARKELIKRFPQFAYTNNDDIGEKVMSRNLITNLSDDCDYLIDDNTNLDKFSREKKLKKFERYYKIGIWFDYDLEVCWHLNWMRMYWFGTKLLPKVTYYTLRKKFEATGLTDGFDKFIKVDKVFREMNLDNKIKYYF
jgi:bifunctional polynucleotide phosphatase/kinase